MIEVITKPLGGKELKISIYEAKRYLSDRLVRGFNTIINPVTGVLVKLIGRIKDEVENICIEFRLPYIYNETMPINPNIEKMDIEIAHYIRKNEEIPNINRNSFAYLSIVSKLITLNIDLHYIQPRINGQPILQELPNPSDTHSFYIQKYTIVIQTMGTVYNDFLEDKDFIASIEEQIKILNDEIINENYTEELLLNINSLLNLCREKYDNVNGMENYYLYYMSNNRITLPPELESNDMILANKFFIIKESLTARMQELSYLMNKTVNMKNITSLNAIQSNTKSQYSSRSIKSRQSSNDIIKRKVINDYNIICVTNLNEIHPMYKSLKYKLIKICNTIVKREKCDLYESIVNNIRNSLMLRCVFYEFRNIDSNNVIASVYNLYKENPEFEDTFFLKYLYLNEYFNTIFINNEGKGPGVVLELFRLLMEELIKQQVFISYRKGERYFINPNFKVSRNFSKLTGIKSEKDIQHFYKFVGNLFAIFIIHNFGINFHLSHCILAHMIYKHEEITNEDYIGYAMMDFPVEYKGLIQILKKPDDAQYLGNFNDFYHIKDTDDEIKDTNYVEYLGRLSKQRLLKQLYSYKDSTKPDLQLYDRTYNRFMSMVDGFQPIRKILRSNKITIPMLDLLLTSKEINGETIGLLINRFIEVSQVNTSAEHKIASENMVKILKDNGKKFPYAVIGKAKSSNKETESKIFIEFIKKLLIFWTGNHSFNESYNYNIKLLKPEEFQTTGDINNILPKSHTCYQQIDIPTSYYNDFTKLYERIVQAVFGSSGFDFLGGNKNKNKNNKIGMPYIIKEVTEKGKTGYKVCKKATPKKCFSKAPLTKEKATKQRTAIILSEKGLSKKK